MLIVVIRVIQRPGPVRHQILPEAQTQGGQTAGAVRHTWRQFTEVVLSPEDGQMVAVVPLLDTRGAAAALRTAQGRWTVFELVGRIDTCTVQSW